MIVKRMHKYFAIAATAVLLTACTAASQNQMEHSTAPGHASGQAPAHVMNAQGGGPEVHYPAPTPGGGVSGGTATLVPTGGGSPEVAHGGRGYGNAGSPYGGRITGNAGSGGPTVQHGRETPARAN